MNSVHKNALEYYLTNFLLDFDDIFDDIFDESIDKLKKKLILEYELYNEDPLSIGDEKIISIEHKLLSIFQMRIIFLYREYEYNLIRLIKNATNNQINNDSTKKMKFYKQEISQVFPDLKFPIKIEELRKVNNIIKHDFEDFSDKIKQIPHFKECEYYHYLSFEKFYTIAKDDVNEYLKNLASKLLMQI